MGALLTQPAADVIVPSSERRRHPLALVEGVGIRWLLVPQSMSLESLSWKVLARPESQVQMSLGAALSLPIVTACSASSVASKWKASKARRRVSRQGRGAAVTVHEIYE